MEVELGDPLVLAVDDHLARDPVELLGATSDVEAVVAGADVADDADVAAAADLAVQADEGVAPLTVVALIPAGDAVVPDAIAAVMRLEQDLPETEAVVAHAVAGLILSQHLEVSNAEAEVAIRPAPSATSTTARMNLRMSMLLLGLPPLRTRRP